MHNPRLAKRYAKSLIDIAQEQNALDAILADMQLIHKVCKASKDFSLMLRSPLIKGDKKSNIIKSVFDESKFHPITLAYINLLTSKGREVFMEEIAEAYINQYNDLKSINTIKLTTATALDESVLKIISDKLSNNLKGQINIETQINPDILGGFILDIKDKSFDASIRRDLNDIKKQFEQNLFVADF